MHERAGGRIVAGIVDQLERAYAGEAWHGPSVRDALDGVDAALARRRALHDAHTIWELVLHLASWKLEVCRRVEGAPPAMPLEGDWPATGEGDTAWRAALAELDRAHRRMIAATRLLLDTRLRDMIGAHRDRPLGSGVSYWEMLLGAVQHDVYHAGQIVILKKG